jgi:hypothetical protein
MAGMTMMPGCVAALAALILWSTISIASSADSSSPADSVIKPGATPVATQGKSATTESSGRELSKPNCAELGVLMSMPEEERPSAAMDNVGCGVRSNVADQDSDRNEHANPMDMADFVSWHTEARAVIRGDAGRGLKPVADAEGGRQFVGTLAPIALAR